MESGGEATTSWLSNIILVFSVIGTLAAGLILSQLDSLQTRLLPTPRTVVATQVAEVVFTSTPLTVISKPTELPATPAPTASSTSVDTPTQSPSPTLSPTSAPTETAVPDSSPALCIVNPNNWPPYIIQKGDTLSRIIRNSGINMEQVRRANCMETYDLVAGTEIFLPSPPPTPNNCVPAPPIFWESYIVVRGDTIYKLARSRGGDVEEIVNEIQEVNCVFGDDLKAGSEIFLPPSSLADASPSATAVPGVETPTATTVPLEWNISSPVNGAVVNGNQPIIGTANFDTAVVQFYKIDLAPTDDSDDWTTLGETHNTPVIYGTLEMLNAAGIQAGEYYLRLVLISNSNFVGAPYVIQITIEN